ncbi:hypothetical protein M0534_04840 [Methylonatrum kenyense]|uniref:hypothetical protein n=1 Tax=Methylonatrum kenyense TaxID=455253 RepID=UPI0020BDA139|nr:hypothetical protein [Methylonatrum kenyense]MCK8515655.1 hypothetical protein [Methylonatrum kenyense]
MLQATHPFQLVAGLLVWAIWFVVLYAGLSVGCAVAPPAAEQGDLNWLNGGLGAISLATTLLLVLAAWRCWQAAAVPSVDRQGAFFARLGAAIHGVSALATAAIAIPVVAYPPCV